MSLALLLDENVSRIIAEQVERHRHDARVESVQTWRDGAFRGRSDRAVLSAAFEESLTLVTYDLKTIPEEIASLSSKSISHAGVVFVDDRTIGNNDFGTLTRALILLFDRFGEDDWTNRVMFLEKPN